MMPNAEFRDALLAEVRSREHYWQQWRRDPYGITIVPSRYNGTYEGADGDESNEGADWLAFPVGEWLVAQSSWADGDNECRAFWDDIASCPVGRGGTPDAALDDLFKRLEAFYVHEITSSEALKLR